MKLTDGITRSMEYQLISEFYAGRVADRSSVPLMNHINEGLHILISRHASVSTKRAFCLHPLVQDDATLKENLDSLIVNADKVALLLAMEYRNIANQYLSERKINDVRDINLSPLPEVNEMLIADKIQNYKDFCLYHKATHECADELEEYFLNWFERLEIFNIEEMCNELKQLEELT